MLYTIGPITGWCFYSKQSVFSLRRELKLFVCFTLIFVVKVKQSQGRYNRCVHLHVAFGNSHVTVFFTSASVHLSSFPLGIN